MKIGVIGLGRMGEAVAWRLVQAGHEVIGFDFSSQACAQAEKSGIKTVKNIVDISDQARIVWLMVPAGKPVDDVIAQLEPKLESGDCIIDGGNSNFHDSVRRHDQLSLNNINFLDCGTSGGLLGRDIGFSLMVGGDNIIYEKLIPIFQALACPNGFNYMGPSGAGHYVKMVHNGVEYALLQAYAEGFNLLKNGQYKDLDLEKISHVWSNGSVVRSWILDLAHNVFAKDQELENISGDIGGGSTGRWTVDEAQKQGVPVDLIEKSLEIRAWSQETGGNYATKVVAMLRNQFGGHEVTKIKE
jgi:6-phosphogluconate dehydrogenase